MKKLLLFLFIVVTFNSYSQAPNLYSFCGQINFNLNLQTPVLIGNENPADIIVTYHTSQSDAQNNSNPIANPSDYYSGTNYETIFARVTNTATVTFTIVTFQLVINPPMFANIAQTLDFPTSALFAEVSGGVAPYTYRWELNGVVLPQQSETITILGNPPGVYSLMVTDAMGCIAWADLTVNSGCIFPPPIAEVVQPSCTDPGSITIMNVPAGAILLYAIDGGAPQTVVGPGPITIPIIVATGSHFYNFNFMGDCTSESTFVPINGTGGAQLSASGTYFDFNANGYIDVGDVINYEYTIANTGCTPINNISVSSSISTVSGGPLATLAVGATDNTTFSGTHAITQVEINTGHVYEVIVLNVNGSAVFQWSTDVEIAHNDGINLVAFVDANGNGIQDSGEAEFTGGEFTYQLNNDGNLHHIGANQSFYLYESNPTTLYDLNFSVNANYASYYFTTASYNDITVAPGSGITTYYFPITVIAFNDLAVNLYNYSAPPRPGFVYSNYLVYRNNGTQTIASGTVTFNKDNVVSIVNISQAGTTATATGFTYNFTNLQAGEARAIIIDMLVPTIPTVALGNTLTNTALVSIPPDDIDTANNTASLCQIIVGSYDPNDKTESHGGKIVHSGFGANEYLTYTIRFENTGTANAINVAVNDVLDSQLDETTVRTIASSHAYTFDRLGSNLTWKFNGIDLPPSVENTSTGHGYVVFEVKPKPGFAIGDVIPNVADIYFDFNPAIVTEPCVTEFVNALATDHFGFDNFKYAPNPVKNTLTVSNDTAIEKITVTSMLGQTVLEQLANNLSSEIDFSSLSAGIYLVKVTAQNQQKQIKITKQ